MCSQAIRPLTLPPVHKRLTGAAKDTQTIIAALEAIGFVEMRQPCSKRANTAERTLFYEDIHRSLTGVLAEIAAENDQITVTLKTPVRSNRHDRMKLRHAQRVLQSLVQK